MNRSPKDASFKLGQQYLSSTPSGPRSNSFMPGLQAWMMFLLLSSLSLARVFTAMNRGCGPQLCRCSFYVFDLFELSLSFSNLGSLCFGKLLLPTKSSAVHLSRSTRTVKFTCLVGLGPRVSVLVGRRHRTPYLSISVSRHMEIKVCYQVTRTSGIQTSGPLGFQVLCSEWFSAPGTLLFE